MKLTRYSCWHPCFVSGYTCDDADGVGGHYYDNSGSDPWLNTQYTTDSKGCATVDITVLDFSLDKSLPVAYRAVVAHLSSDSGSARAACGLAGKPDAAVATMAAYPGYTPGIAVMGTVVVKDTNDGITLTGTLGGLETGASGGIHIHTGVTCDDASLVGGHYFPGMASDPWMSTVWSSDSMGSSTVDFTTPSFSLTGVDPVANRVVVVHDSSGNRIACGVLLSTVGEVVTLGSYPGNAANTDTAGTLVVTQGSAGVSIMGTVTNVEASCTSCGLHIHTGAVSRTSCLQLWHCVFDWHLIQYAKFPF